MFHLLSCLLMRFFKMQSIVTSIRLHQEQVLPISDIIRDTDDVIVYIVPHNPAVDIIVPVFNAVEDADSSYQMVNFWNPIICGDE